ncbi:unnamed protein product [Ambrosiozyma monospora]|uniref:Unnamed protein product n=1 Tax=Ambrosiozyma monospora TaxID=43982 RepID=A0ACB5TY62_AMBMO|nr:unnamed protein product [Ambrosiozyma monospora]
MSSQDYYNSGNQGAYYNGTQQQHQYQQQDQQSEGKRGFISTIVGGYAGSKIAGGKSKSKFKRIGGALVGAYVANKAENMWKKH